jgi:hypothetical protein
MPTALDPDLPTAPARPAGTRARGSPVSARRGFRWSRRARLVLLVTHVLTSVGWFGVAGAIAVFALVADVADDAVLAAALYRSMEVALVLTVGGAVASGLTGVLLGLGSRWGLIRYWWVALKEVATVAVLVTDLVIVRTALAAVVDGRAVRTLTHPTIAHVVVLALATVLSIVKPFGPVGGRPAR